jgi:hypothetical protein
MSAVKDTELTTKKFPKLAETFSIALVTTDLKTICKILNYQSKDRLFKLKLNFNQRQFILH